MIETAYAKINLALHVRKRRDDGYHELETLFAFVDAGDRLSVAPAAQDRLQVVGEFGGELADPFGNIVMQALSTLRRPQGWAVTLEKNLPVAAGLGGGSADAGALFRLVEREYGLPADWHARAAKLGADVPACVQSLACIGRGTGTELEPVENDLAGTPVLLVNPRVPLSTGPVFKAWDGLDRGPCRWAPRARLPLPVATIWNCPHCKSARSLVKSWIASARPRRLWCACPVRARPALPSSAALRTAIRRNRTCLPTGGP